MGLNLPSELVTLKQIIEVRGELDLYIEQMIQSIMRHDKPVKYADISAGLKALASLNQVDLKSEDECRKLLTALDNLSNRPSQVEVSFADEPPAEALAKIALWFRQEINPGIVFKIGLRPTIGAGMVLQTPLHRYDFTIRRQLNNHRSDLTNTLKSDLAAN